VTKLYTVWALCAFSCAAQQFNISTIAGNGTLGYSGDGGPALSAQFHPYCETTDTKGNLYISDWFNNVVRMVAPNGVITTIAGSGSLGYSGDGGPATSAQLAYPCGLAFDAAGDIYIADSGNNVIREITNGTISTVYGTNTRGYAGDFGQGIAAEFYSPLGLAMDSSGNLYISDSGNNVIRVISSAGVINTSAGIEEPGYSGDGGIATAAQFMYPKGIALDASGNLYVADFGNNAIRKISGGKISTIAGTGFAGFSGDGGTATSAQLYSPQAVAVDAAGNVYIADTGNQRVRQINGNGVINTIAGTGTRGYSGDGGLATSAQFYNPTGVAIAACAQGNCGGPAVGSVYVADSENNVIRILTSTGAQVKQAASTQQ
jgi:trimeric autotransporter adhesin